MMLQGLEQALRTDLTAALANEIDDQLLNGDGASPNLKGLVHNRADANAGAAAEGSHLRQPRSTLSAGLLDGKYARDFSGIQLASHPKLMAHVNWLCFRSNESEATVLQWLRANVGSYVTSANLPEQSV